jgi:peptidoglycan/LPS O-acetylase OafA/YrhL
LVLGRRWRPVRSMTIILGLGVLVSAGWLTAIGLGWLNNTLHTTWLPTYFLWYCAGTALAVAHVAIRTGTGPARWRVLDDLAAAPGACWIVALSLLALTSTPIAGPKDLTPYGAGVLGVKIVLVLGVAMAIFIPTAFGHRTRYKAAMSAGPARWLGGVSYGLFLWHPFVLELIFRVERRPIFSGDPIRIFALAFCGALLLATLSYHLMERPLLRWGQRWPRRHVESRQPQAGEGADADQLHPDGVVAVGDGEVEPRGHGQEGHWQPSPQPDLQRA